MCTLISAETNKGGTYSPNVILARTLNQVTLHILKLLILCITITAMTCLISTFSLT